MKSKLSNIFTKIRQRKPDSSSFDLSHDKKLSFNMGQLVPTMCMEVLPGDRFSISQENFLRLAPLVSPVMHKIHVETRYFFVPNRILWPEWEDWITGKTEVHPPFIDAFTNAGGYQDGCLGDYLGYVPAANGNADQRVSALPLAAYLKVYDEYYRDQNLIDEKFVPLVPGENTPTYQPIAMGAPLLRAWQHDYFTACLPFAQKGDEVTLPLIQEGPVKVTQVEHEAPFLLPRWTELDQTPLDSTNVISVNANATTQAGTGKELSYNPGGTLEVDVNSEAATISTLRRAFRLQEWLEKNARGGTRYIEMIKSHFGVTSSDARMQRPEYLGGSRQPMKISEVLSTAETVNSSDQLVNPVGQMSGHGISFGSGNARSFTAEEHGYVIGLINVQPETAYYQGLDRGLQRFDRLDYAWPEFATIGEQEVLKKELHNSVGTAEDGNQVFGYIPRYSEYKYNRSSVHGEMRSSLDFWHMGRKFDDNAVIPPALNEEFIECKPDGRIFAIQSEEGEFHNIYAHVFNHVKAVRKLPAFSVPTI